MNTSRGLSMRISGRLTIFPIVSVPVLSEHSTDMQPRVSTVARFFTSTCLLAIFFATMVRESATHTGRPYDIVCLHGDRSCRGEGAHLRYERSQATDRVDDRLACGLVAGVALPQPRSPDDDRHAEDGECDRGHDLSEEPDFPLHGGQLELRLARHRHDAPHDRLVADGKDDTCAGALNNECGGEREVPGLKCILRSHVERARDHVAAMLYEKVVAYEEVQKHTFLL